MKRLQGVLVGIAVAAAAGPEWASGGAATTLFRLEAEALPTCLYASATPMAAAVGDRAVVLGTTGARLGAQAARTGSAGRRDRHQL